MDTTALDGLRGARTALEAWNALPPTLLDKDGRDKEFVALLADGLSAGEASIEAALQRVSLSEFIRAFMGAAMPFVEMMKDIFALFEKAGADTGPENWRLQFDDGQSLDLDHFRKSIETFYRSAGAVEYPALTFMQAWDLFSLLRKDELGNETLGLLFRSGAWQVVPAAVQSWTQHYETTYGSLPQSLAPLPENPAWVHALWGVIVIALARLRDAGIAGRIAAAQALRVAGFKRADDDAFALRSICQNETDYWLRSLVVLYASVRQQPDVQVQLAGEVDRFLAPVPRRIEIVECTLGVLIEFLELPIWKRRYEFYAAWVGARLVAACEGHAVEVFHDNGAITLPFKETRLAHVRSSSPELFLIAEKRTDLASPPSGQRTGAVQPDYAFWQTDPIETCRLVVEVKHYKKGAARAWKGVFEDYAAAHPHATVLIVNYGPPGASIGLVPVGIADRCRLIGDLRPGNEEALGQLEAWVRHTVGTAPHAGLHDTMILLDVSSSMPYRPSQVQDVLRHVAATHRATKVGVANTALLESWEADADGIALASHYAPSGATDLDPVIRTLLEEFGKVVLVTDDEGRGLLDSSGLRLDDLACGLSQDHRLVEVSRIRDSGGGDIA